MVLGGQTVARVTASTSILRTRYVAVSQVGMAGLRLGRRVGAAPTRPIRTAYDVGRKGPG